MTARRALRINYCRGPAVMSLHLATSRPGRCQGSAAASARNGAASGGQQLAYRGAGGAEGSGGGRCVCSYWSQDCFLGGLGL